MSALRVDVEIAAVACDTRIPSTHWSSQTEIVALSAFSKAGFEAARGFTRQSREES
jgi:hypothetical protein